MSEQLFTQIGTCKGLKFRMLPSFALGNKHTFRACSIAAMLVFDDQRKRLFSLINDLPTVFEVVTERKPVKDKPSMDSGSKSRLSSGTKRSNDGRSKTSLKLYEENYEDDEDEHGETFCGSCGANYSADEFWIGCDICERWFHGKCVKITPAKAENIKQYKCPSCSTKKSKQ
ncbi:alfin-like 1 [Actinidia rufa]|uniref:PHD finger protein ALFIN-LIKE n=1 Tax=Actinidia rufa TaxID=165716 RepID=A0A7J0E6I3_9ERIC|nr:alfin-like 1 [Actinidia rufa]